MIRPEEKFFLSLLRVLWFAVLPEAVVAVAAVASVVPPEARAALPQRFVAEAAE